MAEQLCYGFVRNSIESAIDVPDNCRPCVEESVRSFVQDAMLGEIPLSEVEDESRILGHRVTRECIVPVEKSPSMRLVPAAACGRVAMSNSQ
jgi:hypothetical protein